MIKKILLLLLLGTLMGCPQKPEPVLSPQWFSKIKGDKAAVPLDQIIFSPEDLKTAFTDLKESTYADTSLVENFTPVLNFEYYDLPGGPGIIFDLRCGSMGNKDFACIPTKAGCRCLRKGERPPVKPVDSKNPTIIGCTLKTEEVTGRNFCAGSCDNTQTCFPLMMYDEEIRQSRGVAGCICLPLKLGKPTLP